MAQNAVIIAILFIICSNGIGAVDFDFLMLSLEWPPTFCSRANCQFPTSKVRGWNIHGLWPSNYDNENPEYCQSGSSFDYGELRPIMSLLQTNWANLKDYYSPKGFWSYEWKKHGRCATQDSLLGSELKYFNTSVQLKLATDIDNKLKSRGIVPDDDETYQASDIEDALSAIFGRTSVIRCSGNNWIEARFCFDPSFKPVNCPDDSITRNVKMNKLGTSPCRDSVSYPTFDTMNKLQLKWLPLFRYQRFPQL